MNKMTWEQKGKEMCTSVGRTSNKHHSEVTSCSVSDLQVLQVRPLVGDHLTQELLLQPSPCHREVDERGLGLQLWGEVRVGQFGVQKEPEAGVVLALFISEPDGPARR